MSVKLKLDNKILSDPALVVNSYLFHIVKAEIVNFLNNLLTTIKVTFEQCLRLIQFSGISCSIGLFMSCNPKQNFMRNIFPVFRKK